MNEIVKLEFSQEQENLIKSQIAKDCNTDELKLFLYQCKRTGLDPLTRQIYAIKRAGRMTIQTSIDGLRVIAERSGSYAGQDEPVFTYKENGKDILKCAVTVYRFSNTGQRYPAGVGVAFYDEYYPNPQNLQKTLKHTMIAKVAEALALRKAFPQDLSGLYTSDEMQQAKTVDVDYDEVNAHAFDFDYSHSLQDHLIQLMETSSFDEAQREKILRNINDRENMTEEKYKKISSNLYLNQLDPVTQRGNASAGEINKHMKNKVA